MKLLATHITRYWYSGPVSMCNTEVHLSPRPRQNQTILEYELEVTPTPDSLISREDYFGNQATFFAIAEPHRELIITSRCLADVEASAAMSQRLRKINSKSRAYECCILRANREAKSSPQNECTANGDIHKLTGVLHLLPQIEPS